MTDRERDTEIERQRESEREECLLKTQTFRVAMSENLITTRAELMTSLTTDRGLSVMAIGSKLPSALIHYSLTLGL